MSRRRLPKARQVHLQSIRSLAGDLFCCQCPQWFLVVKADGIVVAHPDGEGVRQEDASVPMVRHRAPENRSHPPALEREDIPRWCFRLVDIRHATRRARVRRDHDGRVGEMPACRRVQVSRECPSDAPGRLRGHPIGQGNAKTSHLLTTTPHPDMTSHRSATQPCNQSERDSSHTRHQNGNPSSHRSPAMDVSARGRNATPNVDKRSVVSSSSHACRRPCRVRRQAEHTRNRTTAADTCKRRARCRDRWRCADASGLPQPLWG